MPLSFGVLGPLQVWDGDGGVVEGLRPAHRRLLAILLLDAPLTVETDRLIDRFWSGEPPATARAALQTHVSAVRRALPDGVLETATGGYRISLDAAVLDARTVVTANRICAAQLEHARFADAAATAAAALDRWRGTAWTEVEDDEFARAEITRLDELRLRLLEQLAEARLGCGKEAAAVTELEGLVEEHPLRERLWEHLIVARQRLGRHAEAVRAFQEVHEHLTSIGLEPSQRLRELEQQVLTHDEQLAPPPRPSREGVRRLPAPRTSFVGRRDDLARVADLVEHHRLVTLTGVGGAGKTRLAIEVARRAEEHGGRNASFVDLASLGDPDLVADAVADALGLHERGDQATGGGMHDALLRALTDRRDLVVLDNCEHLLDAVADLAEQLLNACPHLRLLATSRAPLGIEDEQVHRVPSLSLPDPASRVEEIEESDAVALFLDRARTMSSDFALGAQDHRAIGQICRRLDGIPLAIELAAARTAHLGPQAIAERLDDRFRLLTGGRRRVPRQQTLEATLDWSHDLLDEPERAVLRRLATFPGSFGLDMAEAVCADDELPPSAALDPLGRLVDRSLVVVDRTSGSLRYRLLETVRAYAEDKLVQAQEAEQARTRHRDAVLDWLESEPWGAEVFDPNRLDRLVHELPNIRAALEWSWARGEIQPLARLTARAQVLWQPGIGYAEEGRRWSGRALEHVDELSNELQTACWLAAAGAAMTTMDPGREELERRAMEAGHPLDGLLVNAFGWRAMSASSRAVALGDAEVEAQARELAEEAVALGRTFGGGSLAHALMYRGEVLVVLGDLEAAVASYTEATKHSAPEHHYHYVLVAELATCQILLGDPQGASRLASDALGQIPPRRQRAWLDLVAGLARADLGDHRAAGEHLERAIAISRATPVHLEINECLLYAAAIAWATGDPCTASTLLAAGTSAGDASGMVDPFRSPGAWSIHRHHDPVLRRELGPDSRRCHKAGWGMDLDDAIDAALMVADRLTGDVDRGRSADV